MKATILGIDVECLEDTGSTVTILHIDKYHEMHEPIRPKLQPSSSTLRMAAGNLEKPMGVANSPLFIHVGNKEYEQ